MPPIILLGPTASGKTELAQDLGRLFPLLLVSADSMQVYKGMDIGTAKPAAKDRGLWRGLDLVEPGQGFSVGQWLALARQAILDAEAQGRTALFCGGTGLYFHALSEGLSEIPAVPEAVRAGVEARHGTLGLERMVDELRDKDPVLASRIDLMNPRRVLRGLEVLEATGKRLSDWQAEGREGGLGEGKLLWLGLDPGQDALEERIARRCGSMLDEGWAEEARRVGSMYGQQAVLNTGAIGYAEAFQVAEGLLSLEEARVSILLQTRQFAKRQRTWFRRFTKVQCLDPKNPLDSGQLLLANALA